MAEYSCLDCGCTADYVDFKVSGPGDLAGGENPDYEPDLECPECESDAVYEI